MSFASIAKNIAAVVQAAESFLTSPAGQELLSAAKKVVEEAEAAAKEIVHEVHPGSAPAHPAPHPAQPVPPHPSS